MAYLDENGLARYHAGIKTLIANSGNSGGLGRVIDLDAEDTVNDADVMLVDGNDGLRKMTISTFKQNIVNSLSMPYPSAINVATPPDVTTFPIDEQLDITGMVVQLVWSNGRTSIIDNSSIVITPTQFQNTGQQNVTLTYNEVTPYVLTTTLAVNVVDAIPDTWEKIARVSRAGTASNYFEVGDVINCTYTVGNNQYSYPWIVMGFQDVEIQDGTVYNNALILQAQYATHENVPFDPAEEFEATETTALDGITYYGYDGTNYTYLSLSVGDIIPYENYTKVFKSIWPYRSGGNNSVNRGHPQWGNSFWRQYLNHSGTGWAALQHATDVLPDNASTRVGYMTYLPSDMISELHPIKISTCLASWQGGGTDVTYDIFWPAGLSQMNISYSNGAGAGNDGDAFDYYKILLDSNEPVQNGTYEVLKRYSVNATSGSGRYYFTRSTYQQNHNLINVTNNGAVGSYRARENYYPIVCCAVV